MNVVPMKRAWKEESNNTKIPQIAKNQLTGLRNKATNNRLALHDIDNSGDFSKFCSPFFFSNLEMLITKSNNASAEARSKTASN